MIFADKQTVMTNSIEVLIIYAEPEQFWQQHVQLNVGATVQQALAMIDMNKFPASMIVNDQRLSIFGLGVKPSEILQDKDRIEILKPLLRDPKDNRRQRAVLNPYKKLKKY
jgi:putative ubiquitin-RnfH superfamily antitoxin RatB of RatAB toxin-antitoxin module